MDTLGDVVARMDQASEAARESARLVAVYYLTLQEAGVDEYTCNELTVLYAERLLRGVKLVP